MLVLTLSYIFVRCLVFNHHQRTPVSFTRYKHYIDGKWGDAKECLIEVMEMRSANQYNDNKTGLPLPDGPSTQLLKYMGSHNFTAPTDWDGVHVMEGY
jgi:hypothetical protein|tara:strand:- start:197 stop:490 length:294 start_codon:yes stop_codon:yes gene_type:complete